MGRRGGCGSGRADAALGACTSGPQDRRWRVPDLARVELGAERADRRAGRGSGPVGGAPGGLVLGFKKHAEVIKKAMFPGLTSSHHIHHMAAKAITFAEALEFGKDYAKQVIKNAKVLAEGLSDAGFNVLGEKRGFTKSHQIAVNVLEYSDGGKVEADLEKANIIVNRQLIPGDIKAGRNYFHPGGIRLGVSEITRIGMKQSEMKEIALFIKQVVIDKKDPRKLVGKIKSFRKDYQKVLYCFDNKLHAYEYVKLR